MFTRWARRDHLPNTLYIQNAHFNQNMPKND